MAVKVDRVEEGVGLHRPEKVKVEVLLKSESWSKTQSESEN